MGNRITLKMIDGALSVIAKMAGLAFERHGNNVFNVTNGSIMKYVYSSTKKELYGKLQAIIEHLHAMERSQNV